MAKKIDDKNKNFAIGGIHNQGGVAISNSDNVQLNERETFSMEANPGLKEKYAISKVDTIKEVKKSIEDGIRLKKVGDDIVEKYKIVIKLVDECLLFHNKKHDDILASKLFETFWKELE